MGQVGNSHHGVAEGQRDLGDDEQEERREQRGAAGEGERRQMEGRPPYCRMAHRDTGRHPHEEDHQGDDIPSPRGGPDHTGQRAGGLSMKLARVLSFPFGWCVCITALGQSTPQIHTASPQADPGVYSLDRTLGLPAMGAGVYVAVLVVGAVAYLAGARAVGAESAKINRAA